MCQFCQDNGLEALLERIMPGDEQSLQQAVEQLVEVCYPRAYAFASGRAKRYGRPVAFRGHDAEEAVDDALDYLIEQQLGGTYEPTTCFWRKLTNRISYVLRPPRGQRRTGPLRRSADTETGEPWDYDPAAEGRSPAELVIEAEQADTIRKCIDALPEPDRSLILLRYYQDMQYAQIAAQWPRIAGRMVTPDHLRGRVGLLQRRLRSCLREHGIRGV